MTNPNTDEYIKDIYGAALDPTKYLKILQAWQGEDITDNQSSLETHINFAIKLLTKSEAQWEETEAKLQKSSQESLHPFLKLDSKGTVLTVNEAGQNIFDIKSGHDISALPFSEDSLKSAIANSLKYDELQIVTLQHEDIESHTTFVFMPQSDQSVLVHITDFVWPKTFTLMMEKNYRLTPTEIEVVKLIAQNCSPAQIAQQRDCGVSTIRSHIKSIHGKLGVSRYSDLQMLIYSLSNLMTYSLNSAKFGSLQGDGAYSPQSHERHTLVLTSGRLLEYAVFGDPLGHPVVFLHDAFFGFFWPFKMAELARQKGLKIIAPARPEYGRSEGAIDEPIGITQVIEDMKSLLDHLKIESAVFAARILGMPYAVGMANLYPEYVTNIVGFAPAMPVMESSDFTGMPIKHRFQVAATTMNPIMGDFAGRIAFSYYRRFGAKSFFEKAYKSIPQDLDILRNPDCLKLIIQGANFSSSSGHKTWVHEMQRHATMDNAAYLNCPVPMDFYIGENENNTRAARTKRLISDGASVTLHNVKNAGELFFYTHIELCVNAISACCEKNFSRI